MGYETTPAELAAAVGYASGGSAARQYGRLAKRVAARLDVTVPPPGGWLSVVAWPTDAGSDPANTPYRLREPVVEALQRLGVVPTEHP